MNVAKLMVIFDPTDRVKGFDPEHANRIGIKEASLAIPDDLDGQDIYALAQKLAALMLEQIQ